MKLGQIFRMQWIFNGEPRETDDKKWAVICCACGRHIETSTIMTTKKAFTERLKAAGWFIRKDNKKWECGSHGTDDNRSFHNAEWRIVV